MYFITKGSPAAKGIPSLFESMIGFLYADAGNEVKIRRIARIKQTDVFFTDSYLLLESKLIKPAPWAYYSILRAVRQDIPLSKSIPCLFTIHYYILLPKIPSANAFGIFVIRAHFPGQQA